MKNKKIYIYLGIFIILIVVVLGSKALFNNTSTDSQKILQTEQETTSDEIKVTFLELGSVGCIPCDQMQPIMKEIAEEYQGQVKVIFYDVRTVFGAPYKDKYKIRAIPTQVFLDKNGNEYFRHLGFLAKDELVRVLQMQGVN